MRLPAFNPNSAVRLDLILERDMALYGERIICLSTAIYINKDEYRKLRVVDSFNDPIITMIGVLALQKDHFEIIDPTTNSLLSYICHTYSNIGVERINDSRKKVIRYILPTYSESGSLSRIYQTNQ